MQPKKIQAEIKKLWIKSYDEDSRALKRMNVAITETSEKIAPLLEQKGLQITKGGTSHGGGRLDRIYLEKVGRNTAHDRRTKEYQANVLSVWEWKVQRGKRYSPISAKSIVEFCIDLTLTVSGLSA